MQNVYISSLNPFCSSQRTGLKCILHSTLIKDQTQLTIADSASFPDFNQYVFLHSALFLDISNFSLTISSSTADMP